MKKKEKLKGMSPSECGCNDKKSIGGLYGPISPTGPVNKLTGSIFCFDTDPGPFGHRDYKCDWDVKDGDVVIKQGHSH